MSFNENDYSPAHLLGNTNIPRNLYPTLRGSVRRSDPDGGSAVPYFPSTNGKTLRITYTKEVLGVVTDDQVDVVFASNSYTAIISAINAADSSNVEALDQDGFLVIRNKNQGKTHRLEIEAYTTPSTDDAAPIFGFRVLPFPGSASYAGELSSAPGIRTEQNPQGTALLAEGEDFTSSAFNRTSATVLRLLEKVNAELDRDVIVFREAGATFAEHPISAGRWVATFDDPSVRLPIMQMGIQSLLGGTPTPWGTLDALFEVMTLSGGGLSDQETLIATDGASLRKLQVLQCYYGDNTTALNNGLSFATWGTPDGRSIHGTAMPNKDKHAAIAITSFDGNIVYCQGATFTTVFVKKNDPVEITNPSSTLPFDHTGWFAVEEVIGEEYLRLRPMTSADKVPATAANQDKPKALNPAGLGDLRVAMGYFIPASSMLIEVDSELVGNHRIRFACGVPLREALAQDFGLQKSGNFNALADELYDHITGAADRHAATQISGFVPANTWNDTSTVSGATLAAMINDLIGDLASEAGTGGAHRIGDAAISIGGIAPNTVAAGSIREQLIELATTLRDYVIYNGSSNWADGNPAIAGGQTMEAAVDEIVTDLATFNAAVDTAQDGASKIGVDYWAKGGDRQWTGDDLRSILQFLGQGAAVHAGKYYIPGVEFTGNWDLNTSGGVNYMESDAWFPFIAAGALQALDSDIALHADAVAAYYGFSKLVPYRPAVGSGYYKLKSGTLRIIVDGAATSRNFLVQLVTVHNDNATIYTNVQTLHNGALAEGTHDISITPTNPQKVYDDSVSPTKALYLFVTAQAGTGSVLIMGMDVEIGYYDAG